MENYRVEKKIGEGSYGVVSLAVGRDGKQVVIKVVDTRKMSGKEKKSAQTEIKVLSSLKHPYVIRYINSFQEVGKLCIVMAFAEKGDLYSRIKAAKQGRRIGDEQVLEWFTQGILALKYLHELRILHRDLKSQNMFLTAENRLKIGDFGISRILGSAGAFARTVIGTPYYMAPEVCSERPYSWGSDIWAMGCVMYEMYALEVPFQAKSIKELMQKIVRGSIPQCRQAPRDARHLCARMMARDSRSRPTAGQILETPIIQEQIRSMLKAVPDISRRGFETRMEQDLGRRFNPDQAESDPTPARAATPLQPVANSSPPVYDQYNIPPSAAKPPAQQPIQPAVVQNRLPPRLPLQRNPSNNGMDPRYVRQPSPHQNPLHRDPSAPSVLDGRRRSPSPRPGAFHAPYSPAPSPRLYTPRCPSPGRPNYQQRPASHQGVRFSPRQGARCDSPRNNMQRGQADAHDWYQRALGIMR